MCWQEPLELPDDTSNITSTRKGHGEMMGDLTIRKDRAELEMKNGSLNLMETNTTDREHQAQDHRSPKSRHSHFLRKTTKSNLVYYILKSSTEEWRGKGKNNAYSYTLAIQFQSMG